MLYVVDQVRGAGQQLLDALLVLKHQGAVAAAAAGFQSVCGVLLLLPSKTLRKTHSAHLTITSHATK